MSDPTKGDAEANRVVHGAEFDALALRVAAGEARQRAAGMHDPTCTGGKEVMAAVDGVLRYTQTPCDCWMSQEPA